jgi:hypothetical protein
MPGRMKEDHRNLRNVGVLAEILTKSRSEELLLELSCSIRTGPVGGNCSQYVK